MANFIGNLNHRIRCLLGWEKSAREDAHAGHSSLPVAHEDARKPDSGTVFTDEKKPVIGISGENSGTKSVAAMMTQIRSAGAVPVFLDNKTGNAAEDINKLSGVIIMGSDFDVNPAEYGESKQHPKTQVNPDARRAAYENEMIKQATERKMPLMGVCAGMQRINIQNYAAEGGTLNQHVPDLVGNNSHMQTDAPFTPVQFIAIKPGSQLEAIAGGQKSVAAPIHGQAPMMGVAENSFHHQSVQKVRQGFQASAVSADGVIEAIEPDPKGAYAGQYIMGVQWHPEFGASELGAKLASKMVGESKQYAKNRQQDRVKALVSGADIRIPTFSTEEMPGHIIANPQKIAVDLRPDTVSLGR